MGVFRRAIPRVGLVLVSSMLLGGVAWAQTQAAPDCNTIAAPPPLATFGGSGTSARGETELGLAVGAYGNLYPLPCGHEGASDWLVRLRHGLSDRVDLGFDAVVDNHSGGTVGGTIKLATRYQVAQGLRLEGGVGTSDTGYAGGSVNADVAATLGTTDADNTWNYYTSMRLAGSRGVGSGHAPGALVPLGVIGATARVADNMHFALEAGLGLIYSREHPDSGAYIHFAVGVLFDVGKKHNGVK